MKLFHEFSSSPTLKPENRASESSEFPGRACAHTKWVWLVSSQAPQLERENGATPWEETATLFLGRGPSTVLSLRRCKDLEPSVASSASDFLEDLQLVYRANTHSIRIMAMYMIIHYQPHIGIWMNVWNRLCLHDLVNLITESTEISISGFSSLYSCQRHSFSLSHQICLLHNSWNGNFSYD